MGFPKDLSTYWIENKNGIAKKLESCQIRAEWQKLSKWKVDFRESYLHMVY